ncbi:MAG: superoxide dismutase [Candidatus Magasanikbacteria bacterium]
MDYSLPDLDYSYDALEPYIDEKTMRVHHKRHHQGYTNGMNSVLEKHSLDEPIEKLLENLDSLDIPKEDKTKLRQKGGGFVNHRLFWNIMGPDKNVDQELVSEIEDEFGSVASFKEKFSDNASGVFGSGWSWLVRNNEGNLEVYSTKNQNSPYLEGHEPILGLDVWEHAYYLKYQNERGNYIDNWWNAVKIL